jgi:hypothetical protein
MQFRPDPVDATGGNVRIQPSSTFKTVPNLLDRTATAANITITAADPAVRVVHTQADDPLCEHIGNGIS